ncbi:MAG TPA: nucleoside triphosphate pyrophosphatase [Phenylobacterium sp.]|nr:nucleoside triphosphate pyrophosphatase [Phenylobacterium sp.]
MRLILASRSAARSAVLAGAGVAFETAAAPVDEAFEKVRLLAEGKGPREVAEALAVLKAQAVDAPAGSLVIGADQTLDLDGQLFDKAESLPEARTRLQQLRGREHRLHAAVVVVKDREPIWRETATATLTMRDFSDAFLDAYLAADAEQLLGSVGCYRLEGPGAQLFSAIEGDYFAILGLPLLGLLDLLRREGELVA